MTLKVENGMIRCTGYQVQIGCEMQPGLFNTPSAAREFGHDVADYKGISRVKVMVTYYDETFNPDDLEDYDMEDIEL